MKQMKLKKMAMALAILGLTALTAVAAPTLTWYDNSGAPLGTKTSWLSGDENAVAGWKYDLRVSDTDTLELYGEGASYKLSGSNVTDFSVIVKKSCTITLENYSVSLSQSPFVVSEGATLTLLIGEGTSTITGATALTSGGHAGIEVSPGGTVVIDKVEGANDADCILNMKGGNDSAAIGATDNKSCGNIEINGGTITAEAGDEAACIGGGNINARGDYTIGRITINGGVVNAKGRDRGAGIGVGLVQQTCTVTAEGIYINGGEVTAIDMNDGRAAGIGTGEVSAGEVTVNEIVITGGTVTAAASMRANGSLLVPQEAAGAGIGTGIIETGGKATIKKIEISGGDVTATGADRGAGIGTGEAYLQNSSVTIESIEISGGNVTANGGAEAAGIGTGVANGAAGNTAAEVTNITISGGTVTAKKGASTTGSDIGKATSNNGNSTGTTTMSSVTVTGGSLAAGTSLTNPTDGSNVLSTLEVPELAADEEVTIVGLGEYGTNDIFADGNGKIYLNVPDGDYVFNANGRLFEATVNGGAATAQLADDTGMTINDTDIAYGSGEGWFYDGKTLTIAPNTTATISGESRLPVEIVLSDGADVTLDGVTIEAESGNPAVTTTEGATVTLLLNGTNTLEGDAGAAAIQPAVGATITIDDGAGEGIGKLKAEGGRHAAGIGAGQSAACGDVTIAGGHIEAIGGSGAAGIGAGENAGANCGTITITGGTIEAQRGDSSAKDVGNGAGGVCAGVVVTGGSLVADHGTVLPEPTGIGDASVVAVTIQNDDDWTVGQPVALPWLPDGYGTKDIVAIEQNGHKIVVVYMEKGGETWLASGVDMTAFTPDGENMLLTFSAPLNGGLDFGSWVDFSVANGKFAVKIAVRESALNIGLDELEVCGDAVGGARLIPVGTAACSASAAEYVARDAAAQTVTIRVPKPESGYYLYRVCVL